MNNQINAVITNHLVVPHVPEHQLPVHHHQHPDRVNHSNLVPVVLPVNSQTYDQMYLLHVHEQKPTTHLDHHPRIDPLPVVQLTVPPLDPQVRPIVHVPPHPLTYDRLFKRTMIKFSITNHHKSFNEESIDKVTLVNKFHVNVPSREDQRGGKWCPQHTKLTTTTTATRKRESN